MIGRRRFRFGFRTRADVRADVRDEFAFHLDMRTEELVRDGLDPTAARDRALREFGNPQAGASACVRTDDRLERRRVTVQWLAELRQDATIALRMLARSPGFAIVAILTLALGIGANAAIYSALDAALLRPLPYPDADRLVQVHEIQDQGLPNSVSGGAYRDWREHARQFDALVLMGRVAFNLRRGDRTDRVRGMETSHEFFRVFGIVPLLGRGFLPEDDRVGGRNDVVILTEELWRSQFNADPSIVGREILLDEIPRTVIGVVPAGAWMLDVDQFFVPAVLDPARPRGQRAPHWAVVFGRLRPGVGVAVAEADLRDVKQRLSAEYPRFKQTWSVGVQSLQAQLAVNARPFLLILLGAVALVLLIACANVANLLLARACHREQEIALRAALGATRWRIARQVLTESLVLAAMGGAAGAAVSWGGVQLLQSFTADILPRAMTPRLDARVLAAAMVITAVTGVLFGILPAWRLRRPDLNDTLKNGGKSATAAGRTRTQSLLIVGEVALTLVLVTAAGLLLRSLANVVSTDPGFDPDRVLALDLSLPGATYKSDEQRLAFTRELLTRVRALPGVDAAGTGQAIPFSGGGSGEYFNLPNRTTGFVLGRLDSVSDGYLEALGARLIAGRHLTDADNRPGGRRVAVINEAAARLLFPSGDAVGQQINVAAAVWDVVGVVGNIVDRRLDATSRPFAYVPQVFDPSRFAVAVRTQLAPMSLANAVRAEVQRLDTGVAVANTRMLEDQMMASMGERRLVLTLIVIFAASALLLACIGLYGVMAYSVATRRRELCIRLALGAVDRDLVRGVLRDGTRLIAAGLAIGLAASAAAARALGAQLYHVQPYDPLVIGGAATAVLLVALAACWLPARSATRVNPLAALRAD